MSGGQKTAAVIGGTVIFLGFMFIFPLLALLVGWFVGFVIELATGSYTTDSLNVITGSDRFAKGDFARLTAVVAVLGTFFTGAKSKGGKSN